MSARKRRRRERMIVATRAFGRRGARLCRPHDPANPAAHRRRRRGTHDARRRCTPSCRRAGGRWSPAPAGGLISELQAPGGSGSVSRRLQEPAGRCCSTSRSLARLIIAERVDIVHARSRAPAWVALWPAASPVGRSSPLSRRLCRGSALKLRYNSVMARGDAVIANSHFTADADRAALSVGAGRSCGSSIAATDFAAFSPEAVDLRAGGAAARRLGRRAATSASCWSPRG